MRRIHHRQLPRSDRPGPGGGGKSLSTGDPGAALEALSNLLEAIIDFSVTSADTPARTRFIGRGQSDGTGPAFALIRDRVSRPLNEVAGRLVGTASGRDPASDETRLIATAILSPLTAFHTNREHTLAILNWKDFGGARLALIKRTLREHTRLALAHSARATPPSTGIVAPTT